MRFSFAVVCAVFTMGALPPLSTDVLESESVLVVTGVVTAEYSRIVPVEGRSDATNRQIVLVVKVDGVKKGTAKVGQVVYLHAWSAEKRRDGWVGAGGQRGLPSTGQRGHFHLKQSKDGILSILDPNGGSVIPAIPVKP